jgi:hypothetical protein
MLAALVMVASKQAGIEDASEVLSDGATAAFIDVEPTYWPSVDGQKDWCGDWMRKAD